MKIDELNVYNRKAVPKDGKIDSCNGEQMRTPSAAASRRVALLFGGKSLIRECC